MLNKNSLNGLNAKIDASITQINTEKLQAHSPVEPAQPQQAEPAPQDAVEPKTTEVVKQPLTEEPPAPAVQQTTQIDHSVIAALSEGDRAKLHSEGKSIANLGGSVVSSSVSSQSLPAQEKEQSMGMGV